MAKGPALFREAPTKCGTVKASRPSLCAFGQALLFVASSLSRVQAQSTATTSRMEGVRAFLFYNDRATFSLNVIDNPNFVLRNVIIGEGAAEGPSNATFVTVTTQGPPGTSGHATGVQLIATVGSRQLLLRTIPIGIFSSAGSYVAGFWLYGTGCEPVTLRVRIIRGSARSATMTKTIPFTCGE